MLPLKCNQSLRLNSFKMTSFTVDKPRQQAIVERHTPRIDSPLCKYTGRSTAEVILQDPVLVSSQYFLCAAADKKKFPFLPLVEGSVSSHYVIMISPQYLQHEQKMKEESEGARIHLQVRGRSGYTEVFFPSLSDLFFLRNLAAEDHLLCLPQVRGDPVGIPLTEHAIKTGFNFRIKMPFYGELFARMPTTYPHAEKIIGEFWATIDDRFPEYCTLENHFREIDRRGQLVDDAVQPYVYRFKRWNLNRAFCNALERVLREADLHYVFKRL